MKHPAMPFVALVGLAVICVVVAVFGLRPGGFFHTPPSEIKRLDGITRVLMHEPGRYTFLIEQDGGRVAQRTIGQMPCTNVPELFHDVPAGQPMWAEYHTRRSGKRDVCDALLTIHIHSVTDINGAGWNHGKFGSGQTTIVE